MFLKEQRDAEAERIARASVRILEQSERQSLLAEALTTHGIALARLRHYSAALATFRRALNLAQQTEDRNRVADVTVTVFQELGDRLAVVEERRPVTGRTIMEEIQLLEHDLIKHALEDGEGSITYAALSLGLSYQALTYMLKTRHKDLLKDRSPVRRRRGLTSGT